MVLSRGQHMPMFRYHCHLGLHETGYLGLPIEKEKNYSCWHASEKVVNTCTCVDYINIYFCILSPQGTFTLSYERRAQKCDTHLTFQIDQVNLDINEYLNILLNEIC